MPHLLFVTERTRLLRPALLLTLLCALLATHAHAIVGGKPATAAEAPWMVAILDSSITPSATCLASGGSTNFCQQVCGGVLIAPQWVLTAQHCSIGRDPANYRLAIGQPDLNDPALVLVTPDGYYRHPLSPVGLETTYDNDLALLHLPAPMANRPASLMRDDWLLPLQGGTGNPNDIAEALGWGRLSTNGTFPNVLQHVGLDFMQANCISQYGAISSGGMYDTATMLCAGETNAAAIEPDDTGDSTPLDPDGEGVCVLDSGGPLVTRYGADAYVDGIVSWGDGQCGSPLFPGVYMRVPSYLAWIESATTDGADPLVDLAVGINAVASANPGSSPTVTFTLSNLSVTNSVAGTGLTIAYSGGTLSPSYTGGLNCVAGTGTYTCTSTSDPLTAGTGAVAVFTAGGATDSALVIDAATTRNAGQHDYRVANDTAHKVLAFTNQPDIRASIDGAVTQRVDPNGHLWLWVTISNASAHVDATGVAFTLTPPANHTLTASSGNCTGTTALTCTVGTVTAGSSATYTFNYDSTPYTDGMVTVAATAGNGDFPTTIDGVPDATVSANVTYLQPPPPPPSASSHGGGSLPVFALLTLAALALRRRR